MALIFAFLTIILLMMFSTQPIKKFSTLKWVTIMGIVALMILYIIYFIRQ